MKKNQASEKDNKRSLKRERLQVDGWVGRSLALLIAFLIILGYVDVGAIILKRTGFRFTVRGPLFWRLTSGVPPLLRDIPKGWSGQAYLRLEALLVFLLLSRQASIDGGTMAASGMVLTLSSPLFRWGVLKEILAGGEGGWMQRVVQMLLNLVVGYGLIDQRVTFLITSVRLDPDRYLRFNVSAAVLQRTKRIRPSILTLPKDVPALQYLNVVVGVLLALQALRVLDLIIARGGEMGFGVSGDLLAMKTMDVGTIE